MQNKELLRHCVVVYNNWISKNIDGPIRRDLGCRPEEFESIFRELKELMSLIIDDQTNIDSLNGKYRSYLKSAILHTLDTQKENTKRRCQLTPNLEVKEQLERDVKQISKLTEGDWFKKTRAFITPKLEDFLLPQQPKDTSQREKHIEIESTSERKGMIEAKPPEILQKLLWLKKHGLRYWKLILIAVIILGILSCLKFEFHNRIFDLFKNKPLSSSERTRLNSRTKKRVQDVYETIEEEKLNPWIWININKMRPVTMHNGKVISCKGVLFQGSPRLVFWSDDFIPPFIEDAIVKVFDETIEECHKGNLEPKPYIDEANRLLRGLIWKVYNHMADIDQKLSSKGDSRKAGRKDISFQTTKMEKRLKGHYDSALLLASKNEITENISKSRIQFVGKILLFFSIIWKILVGFALLLGLFVSFITISSKISVRSDDPINCSDPFSTPFQIKNVGYTPVFNTTFLCTLREVKFANRASIYDINTRIDNPPIPKICSDEETTTFFKCLPHKSSITSADIEIAVSYRPMWMFWKREKRFRFATISREDELYWVPIALSQ